MHPVLSSATQRRRSTTRLRFAAVLLGLVAVASACGTSPGTEADFAELLTREGTISESEADCIAGAVFDEYGDDEEVLNRLSFNDFDSLVAGENAVDGFGDFYDDAVRNCL